MRHGIKLMLLATLVTCVAGGPAEAQAPRPAQTRHRPSSCYWRRFASASRSLTNRRRCLNSPAAARQLRAMNSPALQSIRLASIGTMPCRSRQAQPPQAPQNSLAAIRLLTRRQRWLALGFGQRYSIATQCAFLCLRCLCRNEPPSRSRSRTMKTSRRG